MKYLICVELIFAVLVVEALSMELPSNFRPCRRSLPNYKDCVKNAATDAVVSLASGLKSFKILPVEPLVVDSVSIGGTGGSVSLKQDYKNIKLYGLTKDFSLSDVDIDLDKGVIRYNSYTKQVDFVADYTLQGKILLLPITGNGQSNITMLGLNSKSTIYCDKYEKDGEIYFNVRKYSIKFSPTRVMIKFDNLFNGDPVLGEQMNMFLNANADLLFKELQAPYEETFGLVFAKISNDIFNRVPINKIFPE